MRYIDEKFKEAAPADTVERIRKILEGLGMDVVEEWFDSGLDDCFSLKLSAGSGIPASRGKGVTKDFARASAYGEFIERLQGGLFYYKYQSVCRDKDLNIHTFAPDAKYMTVDELVENGDWMDYVIEACGSPLLDRAAIAEQCRMYACADDGKVLTLPFYSIFEKKHVYLPISFVDYIFATNGCCVGNTKTEAWVHALSEILERNANLRIFKSGKAAPRIPDETIEKFPVVSNIIRQIKESGDFDIELFDYSTENGFPVVSTRIINKKTQDYKVNVAADPVFEIAIQRTLTEIFQCNNLSTFTSGRKSRVLNSITDYPMSSNVINQLETSTGVYTADYFANEITCTDAPKDFTDHSTKTNEELLDYLLDIYKGLNRPVYVRNFSFLGFPCYRFVVPGFSEAFNLKLLEPIPEYALADDTRKVYCAPTKASDEELAWMLNHAKMIEPTFAKYNSFAKNSGLLISGGIDGFLAKVTRAYAAYRLGRYAEAQNFLTGIPRHLFDEDTVDYLNCINKYVEFKTSKIPEEKIKSIIKKFFVTPTFERLYNALESGKTPYDEFLMDCSYDCANCKYRKNCCYENARRINLLAGEVYKSFVHGQDEAEFTV